MTTTTQAGRLRWACYRWAGDPQQRVYETLTEAEVTSLTAAELRQAIDNTATVMRDVDTGELVVYDALAMEAADFDPVPPVQGGLF